MTVANIRFVFNTDPVTFFERSRRALQHAALVFEQFFPGTRREKGESRGGGGVIRSLEISKRIRVRVK